MLLFRGKSLYLYFRTEKDIFQKTQYIVILKYFLSQHIDKVIFCGYNTGTVAYLGSTEPVFTF